MSAAPNLEAAISAAIHHIVGPTVLLGSGSYYDFLDPEHSQITIEDVAYGLAFDCRFCGQCVSRATGKRVFYSVAEHCVRTSWAVPQRDDLPYDALMHELGECPPGDMAGPLKSICPDYKKIEKRCQAANQVRFDVTMREPAVIKHWDLVMLATERRDLTAWRPGDTWSSLPGIEPLKETIVPWAPEEAAQAFLARYHELRRPQ
jgi:hypothetical protein